MKSAALLIILLSNHGYWLSGTEGRVAIQWTAEAAATPCDLFWDLTLGDARLGGGRTPIGRGESPIVKITCPEARARVELKWSWKLRRKEDGQEIACGSEKLTVYPTNLTAGWATLLKGKRVIVVDRFKEISALLDQAKVTNLRLDDPAKLAAAVADIVIVGPDALSNGLFEQAPLQALNQTGTAVAVFLQPRVDRLLGFQVVTRASSREFAWSTKDPLLRGFEADDLPRSWERGWEGDAIKAFRALRVAETDAAIAVVNWPAQLQPGLQTAAAHSPAAVDTLLLSRSGGKTGPGRIVLCQMPLGDWKTDPRSQLMVGNVLDVLVSPTPPRPVANTPPANAERRSTIIISPGDAR
jgi:hypothetical protein